MEENILAATYKKKRNKLPNFSGGITTTEYKLEPYMVDGELDIDAFLHSPPIKLALAKTITDGLNGTRMNSQFLTLITRLMGIYTEKQEVTQKIEFTIADRQQVYGDFISGLRREAEITGVCSVCGLGQAVRLGTRLDTEPE